MTETLGLDRNDVRLVPHAEEWKSLFVKEKALLQDILGGQVVEIEHIGSTAIAGMPAKPMLDVVIGVRKLRDAEKFDVKRLQEADIYRLRAEVEGKVVFAKFSDMKALTKTHVYHVVEHGGDWWRAHILFRNYLNENPEAARQYETLKQEAAAAYPDNERAYADAKKAFVDKIVEAAEKK